MGAPVRICFYFGFAGGCMAGARRGFGVARVVMCLVGWCAVGEGGGCVTRSFPAGRVIFLLALVAWCAPDAVRLSNFLCFCKSIRVLDCNRCCCRSVRCRKLIPTPLIDCLLQQARVRRSSMTTLRRWRPACYSWHMAAYPPRHVSQQASMLCSDAACLQFWELVRNGV